MSLKFQEIDWDKKGLMYVSFDNNGETLRWYPRWKDLGDVFQSAWATEDGLNEGKLSPYLLFLCLNMLTRSLLKKADAPGIYQFNQLSDEIEGQLLERNRHLVPKHIAYFTPRRLANE